MIVSYWLVKFLVGEFTRKDRKELFSFGNQEHGEKQIPCSIYPYSIIKKKQIELALQFLQLPSRVHNKKDKQSLVMREQFYREMRVLNESLTKKGRPFESEHLIPEFLKDGILKTQLPLPFLGE